MSFVSNVDVRNSMCLIILREDRRHHLSRNTVVDRSKKDVLEPLFKESLIDGIGECEL